MVREQTARAKLQAQVRILRIVHVEQLSNESMLLPGRGFFTQRKLNGVRLIGVEDEFVFGVATVKFPDGSRGVVKVPIVNGRLYGFTYKDPRFLDADSLGGTIESVTLVSELFGASPSESAAGFLEALSQHHVPSDWLPYLKGEKTFPTEGAEIRSVAGLTNIEENGKEFTILADLGSECLMSDGGSYFWYAIEDEILGPASTLETAFHSVPNPN